MHLFNKIRRVKEVKEMTTEEKKTYILTTDLTEMMEVYQDNGLKINQQEFLHGMQERLAEKLEKCLPPCNIEIISLHKLVTQILIILNGLRDPRSKETLIVSTVPVIATKTGGHCLQINRIVDSGGNCLGTGLEVGARPGYALLYDQFEEIKGFLNNRPVILVEDGSFSGNTLAGSIDLCNDMEIEVDHVVAGLLFPSAKSFIEQLLKKATPFIAGAKTTFWTGCPIMTFSRLSRIAAGW